MDSSRALGDSGYLDALLCLLAVGDYLCSNDFLHDDAAFALKERWIWYSCR